MNFVKKIFGGVLKLAGAGGSKTGSFFTEETFLGHPNFWLNY